MRRIVVLLLLVCSLPLFAQKTEADLRARLVGKPLYLRGLWREDKLGFDGMGRLRGNGQVGPFALAGVTIDTAEVSSKRLLLRGHRVGVAFERDRPRRQNLLVGGRMLSKPEAMSIEVEGAPGTDFGNALHAIFADNLADLVPGMPEAWKEYGEKHFVGHEAEAMTNAEPLSSVSFSDASDLAELLEKDSTVVKPRLVAQPEPKYNAAARALQYSGETVISAIVDAQGKPRSLRVLRPTGLGLDEQALDCISRYVFEPAKRSGTPIPVRLNVAVNFQSY